MLQPWSSKGIVCYHSLLAERVSLSVHALGDWADDGRDRIGTSVVARPNLASTAFEDSRGHALMLPFVSFIWREASYPEIPSVVHCYCTLEVFSLVLLVIRYLAGQRLADRTSAD